MTSRGLANKLRTRTMLDRFEEKFVRTQGCWMWVAGINSRGYGIFRTEEQYLSHRTSFSIYKGIIPPDMCVLHSCDNPPCVNPNHLFLGSQADNIHDMNLKGRGNYMTGIRAAQVASQAARKAKVQCASGHKYTPENTYIWRGIRQCRICKLSSLQRFYSRRKKGA